MQRCRYQVWSRSALCRTYATKATHPREYAIWKKLDRDKSGFLTSEEISAMCRKFDASEHAAILTWILDPNGKGGVDFSGFCDNFKAVQMVRNAARLKSWHRTFGLGVAGNVAGHMQQAGEADASHSSNMPAAVFTFYAPHPHTVDATEDEVLGRLENFPVTNAVIDFPPHGGNVQVEPEMGLLCDIVYAKDSSSVERLIPRRVAAFNDCSIRQLDGSSKLSEKKNWGAGSKGISLRSFRINSISKGSYVDQLCLASYIKRGEDTFQYSVPAPARNYLLFHDALLDWIVDSINTQQDTDKWEEIFPLLVESDYPVSMWIALGAGEYTDWGSTNYLQPKDQSLVMVYDEEIFPNGPDEELVEKLFEEGDAPRGIIALHQTFAILLQAAGRTDRPLQSNRLTFGFQLLNSLTGEALEWGLLLRGPTGALLKEDCFVNPENLDPKLHSFWEGAPVGSCKATGAVAALSLTSALKAEIRYAFALQVQQNPPSTPALNLWYLEAAAEGSSPIDGFEVQRINMEVTPLTEASGSVWPKLDANLVNLSFSLQTNQAQAGLLITVPSNFVFEHSDLCPLLLEVDALADLCASGNCRCHVQASNVMAISLVGRSLTKDRNYVLTLLGVGSEDAGSERKWRMESFADPNFQEGLDAGEVVGFRFCSPVNRLSIGMRNPTNQDLAEPSQDGSAFLGDLQLALELPHAVIAGDMIQVELPSSYELHEMDASCSQLHWWEGNTMSLLPSFIAANCSPQRVVLNFLGNSEVWAVLLHESGIASEMFDVQVHVLVNQALTLQFSTNNPHRIYGRVFWHVRHFRGNQLVAAGAFQNWKAVAETEHQTRQLCSAQCQVFPLLLQTAVELASMAPSKREGQSAMDVGFVAVESATHVRIKGSHGFDFSLATSRSGLVVRTEDANVLLLNRVMQDSEKINLHVLDISLPDSGPAFIDLETLNGDGEVVARKVGLPIPIPGQLTISKSILKNEYQATPSQYPLQSSWPARVGEHILVELEVEFPTPLAQGNMLRLSGHPFQMQGSLDIHSAGALVPTLVHSFTDEEVMVSLAGEGLPSSFPSKIRATVIAPNTSPERSARWSLEVVSESFRPISMGVLEEADIHLVNRCEVEVTSQRSPPLATIEVNVRMRFPDLVPHHVALVAPLGFTFLPDCLKGSVGASATCKPAPLAAASAEVTGVQGLKNLTLSVNTPSITPTSRSWFLLALNQEGNIVAWCEDKLGIRVIQMRSVAMIYPALPEVSSELAVRFLLSDPLPAGGTIQLLSPPEIELNCSGELQQMSLPIQGGRQMTLAFGLPAGLHSFALGLRTPSTNPKQNNFSLFIRSPAGSMHEAVTSVQGRKLKEKVWLSSRPLKHTAAEAGQASSIVIGFEVHEKLGKATLGAVLITMAEDFKHTLRFDGDIEILNKALPIAYSRRDGWAEVQQAGRSKGSEKKSVEKIAENEVDRILIFLDPAQEIPEGAYDFRFPVTVPEELSAFNVWQITLCQPGFAEACSDSESPDALLTFPTTGFGENQSGVVWLKIQAEGTTPAPTPMAVNTEQTQFSIFCTGFEDKESHVEYIFHVIHLLSGCAWKVKRRYSEILLVHELLSGHSEKLPAFPPKGLRSWSSLFGESLPVQRVSAFQEYFQGLLSRGDLVARPELQQLLGVERPPSVTATVRRWVIKTCGTADLELDISAETFSPPDEGSSPFEGTSASSAPTEWVFIQQKGASQGADPLACGRPNEPLCISGLPCGEEAFLQAVAVNGVGRSEPFELQLLAPGQRAVVLDPGMRVRAVWAGDGNIYDAVSRIISWCIPISESLNTFWWIGYVLLR
eukprot:symbB.v1.2.016467.t2/scaffold1252.1/size200744/15